MSLTVRIVAPKKRDAELIVGVLQRHGMTAQACQDVLELLEIASHEPLGPLLIAEESMTPEVRRRLSELVHHQPAWSDFPIVIFTANAHSTRRNWRSKDQDFELGVPILLDRPVRTETLVSTLRAALRARMRQYEVRDALAALRTERDILRKSEERFRRLIESAGISINISDISGHISYCNPTLLRLIGYSTEEVDRGLVRWDKLTPPEFAGLDRRAMEQLLASGTCEPYQKAYRARDGHLIPLLAGMTMLPSTDSDHPSDQVAVFLTDLTSQKQAEAALLQSEKLAAVGRLAASISHEINNPLEAVINLLYLIKMEVGLSEAAQKYLSMAEQELARVSQIATQTLRFHRQSTGTREVAPEELIQSVIDLYRGRLSNSNIEIVYQNRGAGRITCYEGEIRQALNNLVGNALDSMRNGGRLVLRISDYTAWRTGARGVRMTVADTGHGMSAEVRAHIFDAFYTTKDSNGTGLGLWISKGIIEKHRGSLKVKSSNRPFSSGSVFSFVLPFDAVAQS